MSDFRDKLAQVICETRAVDNWQPKPCDYDEADAIIAALPDMVPDLVWDNFDGRGAKATAWGEANYLITRWSNGKFELVESYPGHQGARVGEGFYPSLQAAKSAANAHHRAAIMDAMGVKA